MERKLANDLAIKGIKSKTKINSSGNIILLVIIVFATGTGKRLSLMHTNNGYPVKNICMNVVFLFLVLKPGRKIKFPEAET